MANTMPLPMDWTCSFCRKAHRADLFEQVTAIGCDIVSGDFKADIGLMAGQQLVAAVHISKNKWPVLPAAEYYQSQNIIYIQVSPGDDIMGSIAKPFFVGHSVNPKCESCGGNQYEKSMMIIDSACWKCDR